MSFMAGLSCWIMRSAASRGDSVSFKPETFYLCLNIFVPKVEEIYLRCDSHIFECGGDGALVKVTREIIFPNHFYVSAE